MVIQNLGGGGGKERNGGRYGLWENGEYLWFTSLPCNLPHSAFETRLHFSSLHK